MAPVVEPFDVVIPCASTEETVEGLLARCGPRATICVMPEGPLTIPYLTAVQDG